MLADGRRDLLLASISRQVHLNGRVDNEDGLEMMNILPFSSHSSQIDFGANTSRRNLGQLSSHVKRECTKLLNIDASAGADVVVQVLAQRLPHDEELSLGLQRFKVRASTLRGLVVHAGVVASVLENPTKDKTTINGLFLIKADRAFFESFSDGIHRFVLYWSLDKDRYRGQVDERDTHAVSVEFFCVIIILLTSR